MIKSPLPFIVSRKPKLHVKDERQRAQRSARMTLVSALSGHEGVVFFADTNETISDYSKKTIDKVDVFDFPNHPFRFAIAGAADDSTYADMLQHELSATLLAQEAFDLAAIKLALTDTLTEFYGKHFAATDRPKLQYLVAIQPLPSGTPEIVHIAQTAVNFVGITTHQTSIGIGSYLADYLYGVLLGGGEPIAWLSAIAVYVAREVNDNVAGVGPIDRIVIFDREGGYDELCPVDIEAIQENLSGMNEGLRHFFSLACDITPESDSYGLGETVTQIATGAKEMQRQWFSEWMNRTRQRQNGWLNVLSERLKARRGA
jgi:hypothetical protein